MSNRLFQGIVHQLRENVERTIGIVDENGVIIACSDLVRIGEEMPEVTENLAYNLEQLYYLRLYLQAYRQFGEA